MEEHVDGLGAVAHDRIGWELTSHRAQALLSALRETVTVMDGDGRILYTNRANDGFLGHDLSSFDHLPIELIHPDELDEFFGIYDRCRAVPGLQVSGQFRMRSAEGEWQLVEGSAVNMLADPAIAAVVLITRNLSERSVSLDETRDRVRRVRELADRDALTGLATRTRFISALRRSLERRHSTGWQVALGLVTLGRYEVVGATEGQVAVDGLVKQAAERIVRVVPPDDLVARVDVDTFAILSESDSASADAIAIADAVAGALREPGLPHSDQGIEALVSVLVASPTDIDPLGLLERAELRHRQDRTPAHDR